LDWRDIAIDPLLNFLSSKAVQADLAIESALVQQIAASGCQNSRPVR
jgi:hypothetical protein